MIVSAATALSIDRLTTLDRMMPGGKPEPFAGAAVQFRSVALVVAGAALTLQLAAWHLIDWGLT